MSEQPLIEIEGLTKRFGSFTAVDDVSFTVARGEVLGFLGPNGAGKSTTMRMLAGFMIPTAGRARIAGHDVQDDADPRAPRARLSARGRADLSRDECRRVPAFRRPRARLCRCGAEGARRSRDRADHARRRSAAADRDALEGVQAPRRPGAGAAARSAGAGARRAHRRARSQPEARGAHADRADGAEQGDRHQHAHPGRGGRGVLARHHHRAGAASSPMRRRRSCSGARLQAELDDVFREITATPHARVAA